MRSQTYLTAAISMVFLGAIASALSLRLSHYAFTGFDVSPMIDSGWRVWNGQTPGRDFIATFPPSLYLAVALSYKLFGVNWHSIALVEVLLYATVMVLGLRLGALIQVGWGTRIAVWTTACFAIGQTILLVSINYPWHASMAESLGTYAVMATMALIGPGMALGRLRAEAMIHLALAFAMLLISKPNTSWPCVILCLAVLARNRYPRWAILLVLAAAILAASLMLSVAHTNLWNMAGSYLGLTGRLRPRGFLLGILFVIIPHYALVNLLVYAILVPLMASFVLLVWKLGVRVVLQPANLVAYGAVLIAIIGMGTNFDFKLTDTPLLLLGITLSSLLAGERPLKALHFRLVCTTLALLCLALYLGRSRYRMNWAEGDVTKVSIQDPFLGSIQVYVPMSETLREVDLVLKRCPHDRIFFGPTLEFLYAGRNRPSPLHLPNWWDPGTSYPKSDENGIAAAWQQDHFDLLIFPSQEDRPGMPADISSMIDQQFVQIMATSNLHVYRRRGLNFPESSTPQSTM